LACNTPSMTQRWRKGPIHPVKPAGDNEDAANSFLMRGKVEQASPDERAMSPFGAGTSSSGTAMKREIDDVRRPMSPWRTGQESHKNHARWTRLELCGPGTKGAGHQVIAENDEPSVTRGASANLGVHCAGTTPTGGRRRSGTCGLHPGFLPKLAKKIEITLYGRIAKQRRCDYVVVAWVSKRSWKWKSSRSGQELPS
jgi:hypothetical protein